MNTFSARKTLWPPLGMAMVLSFALVSLCWQQHQLTMLRQQIKRLTTENKQLGGLQEEIGRLKSRAVDLNELDRLRQANREGDLEIARLRSQVSTIKRAEAEAAAQGSINASPVAGDVETNHIIPPPVAAMVKKSLEQVLQRRLIRLREKLNLSPDQAQAIAEILSPQYRAAAKEIRGIRPDKANNPGTAEAGEGSNNSDEAIRALLSPEQQALYASMKEEDAINNARLAANGELIQMQTILSLTADQQDRVFAVLYEQIHQQFQEESAGNSPDNPADALRLRQKRQLAALETVLTPSQLESYRTQQEQKIQLIEKMTAQMTRRFGQ